ncbi:hypothetical protein ATANTOWER_000705 [Ataeniobius toweri]|uniref:Uncharacterized protein n=1 Tax=Ataeniobius toweri TaxID=208326 RepID=A0ABU7C505_9TELE|nr:hypothetical protein [Ataeniobius toweri]
MCEPTHNSQNNMHFEITSYIYEGPQKTYQEARCASLQAVALRIVHRAPRPQTIEPQHPTLPAEMQLIPAAFATMVLLMTSPDSWIAAKSS